MNKAQLIDAIASQSGLSKTDSKKALEAFVSATTDALKAGDKITLVGFGTFSVTNKKARQGHNPSTKAIITIPAKKVAKFKPGAGLLEDIK